ncbi:MAG: RNA polymerase sigma factor (sigma-70 family) [Arenicella sp.]|jgi:RNA polymerase sigma factor (sigma-70 family)
MKTDWKPTQQQNEMEQLLIEQCLAGDRKAQYQVYQQYSKAMFNICVRMLNDMNEAEDVLQEAFLSVFRKINQFQGNSTLGAWIKRIVINQCINQIKKRKLDVRSMEETHFQEPEDLSAGFSSAGFSESEQEAVWQIDEVREAIQELPDGFRVVFSLYLIEGYDHQEIAGILGISESTSKSQFSRAKAKLREKLMR